MNSVELLVAKSVKTPSKAKRRPVRCIDNGIIYASSTDAANILCEQGLIVNPRTILNNCSGKTKSAGGLRWEYADI